MKRRTSEMTKLLTGIGGLDRFTRVMRQVKFIHCLAILLFLGMQTVGKAAPLTASVVFHASTDHAIVVSYFLEVFANGSDPNTATPIASSDLGKPGVDANGDITVDRSTFFNALAPGAYLVTVSSMGAGGPGRGVAVTFSRPAVVPNVVGLTQTAASSAMATIRRWMSCEFFRRPAKATLARWKLANANAPASLP